MKKFRIRADDNDIWEHSYLFMSFESLEDAKKWCEEHSGGTTGYCYHVECEVTESVSFD